MADEIAWRARVNPRTPVERLSRPVERLWRAMDEVVRDSLPTGRVPPVEGWLTGVRDERDARCPRCGSRLRRGDGGRADDRVVRSVPAVAPPRSLGLRAADQAATAAPRPAAALLSTRMR
jgi:hypothetical protein